MQDVNPGESFHSLIPGTRVAFSRGRVWKFGLVEPPRCRSVAYNRIRLVVSYDNMPIWKAPRYSVYDVSGTGEIRSDITGLDGLVFREVYIANREYI